MRKTLLLSLATLLLATTSYAQKTSLTDSIFNLSNVEVTAKKKRKVELMNMDVPLNHLPITVTKLDNIVLERKNIVDMQDAVRFLPGVTVTDQLGAFQRYSIRGSSDAVVMVNGIRDERSLLNTVPFDDLSSVESIEVIKGPASILAGHSVMGGVINIIQKKPSKELRGNAKISYGNWNVKQSTMGLGGTLYGPVSYRANLYYSSGDGYRNVGADRLSGLFTLGSEIGRKGYLEGSVSFNNDHFRTEIGSAPLMPSQVYSVGDGALFADAGDLNPMANYKTTYNDNANNKMRVRNMSYSLQYTQELTSWMKLREQMNYGDRKMDYQAVENMRYRTSKDPIYDWYYSNNKGEKVYVELDSLQSGTPLNFNPYSKTFTNTLEFTGKFPIGSVTNNYAFGWTYSYFDYTQYNGYNKDDVWGPGVNQMVALDNPQLVRNWWDSKVSAASIRRYNTNGLFLHDVIDINEHWKAMVGGRFDLYNYKTASATITDGRKEYHRSNRSDWKQVKTSAFTYRAGLVYFPIPELSFYASAASYFKPVVRTYSKDVIYLDDKGNEFNPDEAGGKIFRPEKGNQWELGLRYELNSLLEVNASVFYISKKNMVKSLGNLDVTEDDAVVSKSVQAQVGRAMSKGFDMDITFRPLSTLQIVGGWGWSDYRLRKVSIDTSKWSDFNEATNLRATGVPRTTFYAYADYSIPKGVFKDLSFHLSGSYTDRIYRNIPANLYFPSIFLVDAGVYYTIKKQIHLSLVVNNLFDKEHFVKTTTLGKPRNFMASVSYTF